MHNLNVDPTTLFKALFLAQLPSEVRRILASSEKMDIRDLAREADRITEVSKLTNDSQVNVTGDYCKPFGQHPGCGQKRNQKVNTKSDQTWPLLPCMWKYYSRFGNQARYCLQHRFRARKLPNRSTVNNLSAGVNSALLHVFDSNSSKYFLMDTDSKTFFYNTLKSILLLF